MKTLKKLYLVGLLSGVVALAGACATTPKQVAQQAAPPKVLSKLAWEGPCEQKVKGKKTVRIYGFKVRVLDADRKTVAEKYLPTNKDDPNACSTYMLSFKDLPDPLAAKLAHNDFKGWLSVASVGKNKREIASAALEYPVNQ